MAFQTNTLVNGEWTTRTVDTDTILRHYNQSDNAAHTNTVPVDQPPEWGILTQTIVQSPLVNYVLPAKLRSPDHNDVAFVGENFVQIKELRGDGFLWDVVRKEDFGVKIRNARIVGSMEDYQCDPDVLSSDSRVKNEQGELDMHTGEKGLNHQQQGKDILPPQFLLLQLDTGDSVFLMIRLSSERKAELVITARHRVSRTMLHMQPGVHMSVDPSSRYMAVACSEAQFAIYELRSRDELRSRYIKGSDLKHVVADTFIPFKGVIQKMEFLYPSADEKGYVVLLVLLMTRGRSRMVVYEWKTGDDIRRLRPLSNNGHELPLKHQMPLLLIPLKFRSTFILVYEEVMALFKNVLQGAPDCIEFYNRKVPPTSLHHGSGTPLWAGWARPANRVKEHDARRDDIYIAREDGLLKFFEIERANFVECDMIVGELAGRCGTALACIDYGNYENNQVVTGDLLITGGDSCAGGAYLVQARETPLLTQPIENWTPAQDFAIASARQPLRPFQYPDVVSKYAQTQFPKPDRLFACVGKGSRGALSEFRYGLKASIGLQMDYEQPITRAWTLPSSISSSSTNEGSLFLLAFEESSAALFMSSDETSIEVMSDTSTRLDLKYRTLAINTRGSCTIQVTEQSVMLIDGMKSNGYDSLQLLRVTNEDGTFDTGTMINDAVIHGSVVLYTTFVENTTYLQALSGNATKFSDSHFENILTDTNLKVQTLGKFAPTVTGLAIYDMEPHIFALVAEWLGTSVTLSFTAINNTTGIGKIDVTSLVHGSVELEAITSIVVFPGSPDTSLLLCGTRNGFLLIIEIDRQYLHVVGIEYKRVGATLVTLTADESPGLRPMVFLNCDSKAYALTVESPGVLGRVDIHQIWLTDAMIPELTQPTVTSIVGQISMKGKGLGDRLLLVAGTQLVLSSLDAEPKAILRHMQIGGTPSRLLYSSKLDVLVVGATVGGKSTILFIEPDSGEDLSCPVEHKDGQRTQFLSGLGNTEERIFRLFEWSYIKDNKTWDFIIVSTSTGRLLIISVDNRDAIRKEAERPKGYNDTPDAVKRSKIVHYTRHKFRCPEPVHSVTGFSDGLLWCTGDKLLCDVLDLRERKFKRVAEYALPSAAINLDFKDGIIYALTQEHSLELLELVKKGGCSYEIVRICGDQLSRYALHHTRMEVDGRRPLHLISDKFRSVIGLWPIVEAKAEVLDTVFEGQLPSSILRFQKAECRPVWDPAWGVSSTSVTPGFSPNLVNMKEVLGLSIDGSLCRLAILDHISWAFLRFVIELCIRSPSVCEFTYQDTPMPVENISEPKIRMHIDGDILRRCLKERKLEEMLRIGENMRETKRIFSRFYELLQHLHHGSLAKNAPPDVYINQAYSDLRIYLRPVL